MLRPRLALVIAAAAALAITAAPAFAGQSTTGNGGPSGAHYNLNIIGVPKGKTVTKTMNNGRRIFVALYGKTKINLYPGTFKVLDFNGTDGTAAFRLPVPDPGQDGVLDYSVFARALGKPGGSVRMTTCFTDSTGATYCSAENYFVVRSGGKSKFTNVSNQLLTAVVDTNNDGCADTRVSLFSDPLAQYYWDYDNNGMKLLQLRFYEDLATPYDPVPAC